MVRLITTMVTTLLLFLFVVIMTATTRIAATASSSSPFVTRNGTQLLLDGKSFRYSGANIYWLGLDDTDPPGTLNYPTHFRISDALATAKGMGGRVVRAKTLGTSTGNRLSFEPALDIFQDAALEPIDFSLNEARRLGLKLVIPLTDGGDYYHGWYGDFTAWLNISDKKEFFTNRKAIDAFKRFVFRLLNHTNRYNGIRMADDSTILAWETGNELPWGIAPWTREITEYIKSISKNILTISGRYGVGVDELDIPSVDMYSDHFYPPWLLRLGIDAEMCRLANKALIVGEYDWSVGGWGNKGGSSAPFLDAILKNENISGALYWSLHAHTEPFGFELPKTPMHYPGATHPAYVRGKVVEQMRFAANISSSAAASSSSSCFIPQVAPVLHPVVKNNNNNISSSSASSSWTVTWRGSAGACIYDVLSFPGREVLASGVTDFDLPLVVKSSGHQRRHRGEDKFDRIFVLPYGCNCVSKNVNMTGPASNVVKV